MSQRTTFRRTVGVVRRFQVSAIAASLLLLAGCESLQHQPPGLRTAHHKPPIDTAPRPAPAGESGEKEILQPAPGSRNPERRDPAAVAATDDLWERIRLGMALEHATDEERVSRELQWFARHQEYLDRCTKRAALYLHHVVGELEKRDMPMEIALLPIVESAFNPYAHSRSNASGMWQFIGSTGRIYGLRQDWWYDGRRDVLESTRAALDYLEKLHNQFGDWTHALAAYNSGERRVERAIEKNLARGKPTDFFSLHLPSETRAYVPKLLAISRLVADPDTHGVRWLPVANEPHFEVIETGRPVALADVARLAGISQEDIYHLNPGFARWATPPKGPHRVLVPVASAERVRAGLDQVPEVRAVAWQQYEVERGDTLSDIARQFSVSVAALRANNQLRGNLIKPGQTLSIPVPGVEGSGSGAVQQANNPFIKPWHHPGGSKKKRSRTRTTTYTVRRGDNLWNISRKYRVGVHELARWNGLSTRSILRPGQKLKLQSVSSGAGRAGSGDSRKKVRYQVRGGDSLWTIARRFQVRVADLRSWNSLRSGRHLMPGQRLTIFVD